jgi:hypothetical protein
MTGNIYQSATKKKSKGAGSKSGSTYGFDIMYI